MSCVRWTGDRRRKAPLAPRTRSRVLVLQAKARIPEQPLVMPDTVLIPWDPLIKARMRILWPFRWDLINIRRVLTLVVSRVHQALVPGAPGTRAPALLRHQASGIRHHVVTREQVAHRSPWLYRECT